MPDIIDPDAVSIENFCRRHSISTAWYYELRRRGRGPRELRIGRKVLITREAAAEWRRNREAETVPFRQFA
jgi:predicted DNA-binding transcriptional regulator AlpA